MMAPPPGAGRDPFEELFEADFEPPDPYPHPAALPDEALLAQCSFGSARSSGPGGQHRNKVETEVRLVHTPSGLSAKAGERRSQIENKRMALKRLRFALAVGHREPIKPGPVGSKLWRRRRQAERIVCNPEHRDLPALIAEALDVIADADWRARRPAIRLGVTRSQLIKLVRKHAQALAEWNAQRAERGLHALH